MHSISPAHREACTVQNALSWGMCRSHLRLMQVQNPLHIRITHLVLAILEAIPVIGQLVSLVELTIVHILTRSQLSSYLLPRSLLQQPPRSPFQQAVPLSACGNPQPTPSFVRVEPASAQPTPSPSNLDLPSARRQSPLPTVSIEPLSIHSESSADIPSLTDIDSEAAPSLIRAESSFAQASLALQSALRASPVPARSVESFSVRSEPNADTPFPSNVRPQPAPSQKPFPARAEPFSPLPRIPLASFEKTVANIHRLLATFPTRPEPISCIPRIPVVAVQETPDDIRRIWPRDLQLLGITEAQKTKVDFHIREAFRAIKNGGEIYWGKKTIIYTNNAQEKQVTLPIRCDTFNSEGLHLLLYSKVIFASGAERKIRWVYDLTKGTFALKKRITGVFEEKILKHLLSCRAARGIESRVVWRTSLDKQNQEKRQIIEPVRDGTLAILFKTAPLSNFAVKRDLILDLLQDLHDLHTVRLSGVQISSTHPSSSSPAPLELSYSLFHSDIKLSNVLTFFQNGKWRAELCDFGMGTANPSVITLSRGYTPPEYIRFYKENYPLGIEKESQSNLMDLVQFNVLYGRDRDIWSLGLIILSLLVEKEETVLLKNAFKRHSGILRIPPLPCLRAILSDTIFSPYDEIGILNLKQTTLDADLDQLEKETISRHPEEKDEIAKIFTMLKTKMLRIDPAERQSIEQCLSFLEPEAEQIA